MGRVLYTSYAYIFGINEVLKDKRVRAIHSDISKRFDGDKNYVVVQQ